MNKESQDWEGFDFDSPQSKELEKIISGWYAKQRNTSGHKKLVQYLEQMFKTDYFVSKMTQIRKDLKIPINGFPPNPHFPIFPKEWVYRKDLQKTKWFRGEIKNICKKFSLHYMDWYVVIEEKIFYNTYTLEYSGLNSHNLCIVSDVVKEYSHGKEFKESDDMAFPIAIRISPYATERDIIDFVKSSSLMIKSFQSHYIDKAVKIGKIKKKKPFIQERNELIYQNRNLPSKEIMKIVYDKFGPNIEIDQGYIGKIISLEKKKRKDM